jgi:hypothetical protein
MFSLADIFAFLHEADPKILRLVKDEIARDLGQRQSIRALDEDAKPSDADVIRTHK